jgi:hypothetical protein
MYDVQINDLVKSIAGVNRIALLVLISHRLLLLFLSRPASEPRWITQSPVLMTSRLCSTNIA